MEVKITAEKVWQIFWNDKAFEKNSFEEDPNKFYYKKDQALKDIKKIGKDCVDKFVEKIILDDLDGLVYDTKIIKIPKN